ncbi:MAG: hypothetical protein FWC89_10665 [Defluviitaleaceae bacterium]|nr:hypothetical protein [Defluviitaleaceae bacterium]
MDINKFTARLDAFNWHNYEHVPSVLKALALATEESTDGIIIIKGSEADLLLNAKISNSVLSTIGNNHGGYYYPVAVDALPFIAEVALYGNHIVARNCAINILIDLYYFCPDVGCDDLMPIVRAEIENIVSENIANFIKFADDDKRNTSLIHESLMSVFIKDGEANDI